jgi:hypothetical protein
MSGEAGLFKSVLPPREETCKEDEGDDKAMTQFDLDN